MSFILDALKKSESDRQQKATPDISDVPTARSETATPRLLLVVTGLLSVTVIILLAVLLWPAQPRALTTPTTQSAPATAVPGLPATVATAEPVESEAADPAVIQAPADTRSAVASPAPPAPAPISDIASDDPPASRAEVAEPATTATPTSTSADAVSAPATTAPSTSEETETYLTLNDLRATGKISLPDMHIDLHVYSDVPSERFVFINMNQYRENATLSEGPKLQQITSDGVLLEYVGTTFLLPRE